MGVASGAGPAIAGEKGNRRVGLLRSVSRPLTSHLGVVLLALVLLLALGLRVWSLGWGMPYTLHGDEPKYLPRAVVMLIRGDLNPHYFENPPLLTYGFLAELLVYLQVGKLLGFLNSATDVGTQLLVDPTRLYLMARGTTALLGTGTVLLAFLIGRRLVGRAVGLTGALLLGVSFLHVRDSHYAVNDVAATFLLMLGAWLAMRLQASGRGRYYALGGVVLGLGVATKYNIGLGAVMLVAAHFLRADPPRGGAIRRHVPLVGSAVLALAAFLAANPYAVLDFAAFLKQFASQYQWTSDPFSTSDVSISEEITRALTVGIGPVALAAAVFGAGVAAIRRRVEAALLLSFPVLYLAFFLTRSSLFYARFAIPVLPFVAIFAAVGLVAVARLAWRRVGPVVAVGIAAVLIAGAVVPSLAADVRHDSLLRLPDTRVSLGQWIEANVPPGSKLAVEGYTFLDSEGRHIGARGIEYEIEILPSLRANPMEYYRQQKFDYLISSSFVYGRYPANPDVHAGSIDFYRQLETTFRQVATFSPRNDGKEPPFVMDEEITPIYTLFERDRPGPYLKVYAVDSSQTSPYGVAWLAADGPSILQAGTNASYAVAVRNTGPRAWPSTGFTAVRVGYHWLDAAGHTVDAPDEHASLPRDLAPGEEAKLAVEVVAPRTPGSYTLRLDVVQENFAWLSAKGAETRNIRVEVAGR